jgi:hypothetical protein
MRHDAPPVLAVVGLLGALCVACLVMAGVFTYKKWVDASELSSPEAIAFGDGVGYVYPKAGTIVYYRSPRSTQRAPAR